jgi:hypothetical protein
MKRSVVVVLLAVAVVVLFSTAALAAGKGGSSPPPYLESAGIKDGYAWAALSHPVAVFFGDPGIKGAQAMKDPHRGGAQVWVLDYDQNPGAFEGVECYALGLGQLWPGPGKDVNHLELDKALARGEFSEGVTMLGFRLGSQPYHIPWNTVYVFPGGKRGWGGHPGYMNPGVGQSGPFTVFNMKGLPMTVTKIDPQQGVGVPDSAAVAEFKKLE